MKSIKTALVLLTLALAPAMADNSATIDKDGCVKGKPCKCADCGQICGSNACKAGKACKGDACTKS